MENVLFCCFIGNILLFSYGLTRHHTAREIFSMSWSGVRTGGNILMIFALIGCITALWRRPVICICCLLGTGGEIVSEND